MAKATISVEPAAPTAEPAAPEAGPIGPAVESPAPAPAAAPASPTVIGGNLKPLSALGDDSPRLPLGTRKPGKKATGTVYEVASVRLGATFVRGDLVAESEFPEGATIDRLVELGALKVAEAPAKE